MVKITSIVDFVTTVPFFVLLVLKIGIDGVHLHSFSFLSVLRILRIFRLLKMERFMFAILVLERIFSKNASLLFSLLFFELALYLVGCSLLYLLENDLFPSIPAAFYMGVLILIGAGTPPEESLSVAGKILVGVYIFLSVVMFALPAGILAGSTGIESVAEELQKQKRMRKRQKMRQMRESQLRNSALNNDENDDDLEALFEKEDWEDDDVITCPHCHKQFSQD
jgi:voltage-gated potassium channel